MVLRLSGPLSSWGENAHFLTRPSLDVPTFSALKGMCRAALGHGRKADFAEVDWLDSLTIGIRIDSQGRVNRDYHTVNPRKSILEKDNPFYEKERKTLGTVTNGSGDQAKNSNGSLKTEVTERYYREDATYIVMFEGEEKDINKLYEAFDNPIWTLSMGRKKCIPDWLFLLGVSDKNLLEIALELPCILGNNRQESRELQVLSKGYLNEAEIRSRIIMDRPLGSHPHEGYIPNTREIITIKVINGEKEDIIKWSKSNLRNGSTIDE